MANEEKNGWKWAVIVIVILLVGFGAFRFGKNKGTKLAPVAVTQTAPAKAPDVAKTPEVSKSVTAPAVAQAPVAPALVTTVVTPAAVASKSGAEIEADRLAKDLAKAEERSRKLLAAIEVRERALAEANQTADQAIAAAERVIAQATVPRVMVSESHRRTEAISGSGIAVAAPAVEPVVQAAVPVAAPEAHCDGEDVLVYDVLIRNIPGFDPNKPVLAAWDKNGWFVNGPGWATSRAIRDAVMTREGEWWRARGLCGVRFHPVQLDEEGSPKWALIERVYPLNAPTVNMLTGSPCLLARF